MLGMALPACSSRAMLDRIQRVYLESATDPHIMDVIRRSVGAASDTHRNSRAEQCLVRVAGARMETYSAVGYHLPATQGTRKGIHVCRRLTLSLLTFALLEGCSFSIMGHLYPVQGPLAQQTPLPVYVAKLTGARSAGHVAVTLPDGESCAGPWVMVPPGTAIGNLSAAWDLVYGKGFYVAQVLGTTWYAHADLTGPAGPCLAFEMRNLKPGSQAANVDTSLLGVAQDPYGNVFKVTFTLTPAGS